MNTRYLKALTAVLLALALNACAVVDPYTGEAYIDPGATALLIGGIAVAGAAAHAAVHSRRHHHRYHHYGRRYHRGYRHYDRPYRGHRRYRYERDYGGYFPHYRYRPY